MCTRNSDELGRFRGLKYVQSSLVDSFKEIPNKRIVKDDYIFCYFLGNNPEQRTEVGKLAKLTGLKIVMLRHLGEYIADDERFGDYAPYDIGPGEFVNLIRYADYVCTDSFHGSVFSVIYQKQFISFNRYKDGVNSRNSRLDTLFTNTGINRRYQGNIIEEIMKPIDYDEVEIRLSQCRRNAERYLKEALIND